MTWLTKTRRPAVAANAVARAYNWGGSVNGHTRFSGQCNSCRGTGRQTIRDMMRNRTYNTHKIARLCSGEWR